MTGGVRIISLSHLLDATQGVPDWLARGLDEVFYDSSNTKSFADDAERARFRQRWLGRYLQHDARWAYVAVTPSQKVAGYLVGAVDDPALSPRFADIGYFAHWAALTKRFPAHLHVNLSADYRSCGLGSQMIELFATDAAAGGSPGVHVVTSRGARNVAFYARNGFAERGAMPTPAGEIVFLGRSLRP